MQASDLAARAATLSFALGPARTIVTVEPFAGGLINASWRLTAHRSDGTRRFLLQRVNDRVFPEPLQVMDNVMRVVSHSDGPLELVRTLTGAQYHVDDTGAVWRAWVFIENAVSRESPSGPDDAYRAARAFGDFQRRLSDLPGPRLHETIPHFHDTPARVATLERAVDDAPRERIAAASAEIVALLDQRSLAGALIERQTRGELSERLVHNDAKMSNVMLDTDTGEAVCVVDLDTVMPGLALYDFGDMARSMSTTAAEDEPDVRAVTVSADLFEALARGYLDGTGDLLEDAERGLLVTAARVITYEQAVRFLTDFLDGDRYYRIERPLQNLERCRAQLALLGAMSRDAVELERRVRR